MDGLSENFAVMQKKLDRPDCFGQWEKSVKCGTCWFWPLCKKIKPKAKSKNSKQKELI